MIKEKRKFIGKKGIVYSNGKPYKDAAGKTGFPNGENRFIVKDEHGKDLSPYVWFESELEEL